MGISSFSVKKKIYGTVLITLAILIGLALFFVSHIQTIKQQLDVFSETTVPSMLLVKDTNTALVSLRKDQFSLLPNTQHPDFNQWVNDLDSSIQTIDGYLSEYEQGLWDERDRQAFDTVASNWRKYRATSIQFASLLTQGKLDSANTLILNSFPDFSAVSLALQSLTELNQTYIVEDSAAAEQIVTETLIYGTIAVIVALLLATLLSVILANQICTPLELVRKMALSIAAGDLTYKLQRDKIANDELGELADACEDMQQKLQVLVGNISNTSVQIGTAIEEVSAISTQTSQGMHEQQEQISLIATAMNQMQATVNEVAGNTEDASTTAGSAQKEATSGLSIVETSMEKTRAAERVIADTGHMVEELEADTANISVVVDVIQEIAEQTNLLALNAAIEAARAGEQGRGFAVVADEVRTLASRTQSSTEEIINIIDKLQNRSKQAVEATRQSSTLIQSCVEQTQEASSSIQHIERNVENIAEMSIQIASACSEQSSVTEELNRNVESINVSSNEVAEGAKQTAQACHSLSELATGLQDVVRKFRIA